MDVSIVVAYSSNGVIGRNGGLPWHLSADLKHFKAITMGKAVVMGRITHESIGRVLPGRENIVLSRDPAYHAEGCTIIHKLEEMRDIKPPLAEVMIIGGASLYAESLGLANRIYLTEVHTELQGDVYFPDYDVRQWRELERQFFKADDNNDYDYSFVVLERV